MDAVLALGAVPVTYGSFPGRPLYPWQARARAAEVMDATDGVNLEQLAAARVDLVVVNEIVLTALAEEVDDYQRLAPVVALPDLDFAGQLRIVADSLGIDRKAARERAAEVVRLLDAFRPPTRPASIAAFTSFESGSVTVFTADSNGSRLLERVGLPSLLSAGRSASARPDHAALSLERITELDAAEVLIGLPFENESLLDELEASPLFGRLDAVRTGSYHRLSGPESQALIVPSVLSVPVALDALRRVLAG